MRWLWRKVRVFGAGYGSNLVSTISRRFVTEFLCNKPLKILELPIRVPPMRVSAFWHERMQSDPRSRWFRRLLVEISKRDLG